MKPNDKNAALRVEQHPFRVMIIAGSQRKQYNCPCVDETEGEKIKKLNEGSTYHICS